MHMTATLTKWYEEHGRHEIFAGGKKVKMDDETHSLLLRENIVTTELQHDLDNLGIAKNAREEKKRARGAKMQPSAASRQPSVQVKPESTTVDHSETPIPRHLAPPKNDWTYKAPMAAM